MSPSLQERTTSLVHTATSLSQPCDIKRLLDIRTSCTGPRKLLMILLSVRQPSTPTDCYLVDEEGYSSGTSCTMSWRTVVGLDQLGHGQSDRKLPQEGAQNATTKGFIPRILRKGIGNVPACPWIATCSMKATPLGSKVFTSLSCVAAMLLQDCRATWMQTMCNPDDLRIVCLRKAQTSC